MKRSVYSIILVLALVGFTRGVNAQSLGTLYGLTFAGGAHSSGVLFSFDSLSSNDSVLFSFLGSTGYSPKGNVMQASNGLLYGMTWRGGSSGRDKGVIFSYDIEKQQFWDVFDLGLTYGGNPYGNSLIQASNGLLYGMTSNGGIYGDGVIFAFDPLKKTDSVLVNFNDTNGTNPYGNLLEASDHMLYGMTNSDISGNGVLFRYNPVNGKDTVLMTFSNVVGNGPYGSLIQARDGLLYGITYGGGNSDGVIFSYNIKTFKDSVRFKFNGANGKGSEGSLMQATDGYIYGLTAYGGAKGDGVMFAFDPVQDTESVLINFNNTNGENPNGSLIQGTNGLLYGTASAGGSFANGVLFSYDIIKHKDSVLVNFNNANGNSPYGDLIEAMTAGLSVKNNKLLCYGDSIAGAKVTVRGGARPITYSWSNGATVDSVYGLKAGAYKVLVVDAKGVSYNFAFTVTQPSLLKDSIATLTTIKCNGDSNGAIAIKVSGGVKPYSYLWSPGNQTVSSISALPAGSYTFTATDSNHCVAPITVNVTQPAVLKDSITEHVNVLCYGFNTGSATVDVKGGTKPYIYSWIGKAGQVSSDSLADSLITGSYTCQITDAHTCVAPINVVITSPAAITDSTSYTSTPCTKSTGSATVFDVAGGVYPYSYLWSPGGDTTKSDTGLSSGTYFCTITDSNKCIQKTFVVVPNTGGPRDSIISFTNETCYGQNIGSASAGVKGGYLPYTFKWTPSGGNTTIANNLAANTYTFSVTDSIGCVSTATVNISEPPMLRDSITKVINVSCFGFNNGRIVIGIKGGVPPYNYVWSNGAGNADSAANLAAGTYSCTITDSNNCNAPSQVTAVTSPNVLNTDTMATSTKCGTSNGSATLITTGGTRPYTYLWSNAGSDSTITNVPGGITYTCQITDAKGCVNKVNVIVPDTGGPRDTVLISSGIKCYGSNTGSAIANVLKGTPPYYYSWSPSSLGTNGFAIDLAAGSYSCTVTDATGCKGMSSITLTQPTEVTYSFDTVGVCYGANTGGSAIINVNGGIPPYQYSWSPVNSTTDSLVNVGPGSYICKITDFNNCQTFAICAITEASKLNIDSIVSHPTSCPTCNDGWVQVFASGGIPGGDSIYYLYVWDSVVNASSIHNLDTGMYHVCVTTNYCFNESVCDSVQVVTGIATITSLNSSIKVFPVPSRGVVNMQLPEMGTTIISVFDEMGRNVYATSKYLGEPMNMLSLDLEGYPNGVYTTQIKNARAVVTKKVVIQK